MTYVLPERTHLVHKAIDVEKLSAKNKPEVDESTGLPAVKHYLYQRKYDGCCVIVIIDYDLNVTYWSRDGKPCTSLTHLTHDLQRLPPGTVLFAEAWQYGKEFREISGAFRRKAEQPELSIILFDTVRLHEFEAGRANVPYTARLADLCCHAARARNTKVRVAAHADSWEAGSLAQLTNEAYDGIVAKLRGGSWTAGAGTGGEVLKIKNVIDVDLLCTGIEEEHDKHGQPKGRLGAILCDFEGTTLGVGTGFNAEARTTFWREPEKIVGQIVRVVGMKASGKGSLREPRFKGVRYDKDTPDY